MGGWDLKIQDIETAIKKKEIEKAALLYSALSKEFVDQEKALEISERQDVQGKLNNISARLKSEHGSKEGKLSASEVSDLFPNEKSFGVVKKEKKVTQKIGESGYGKRRDKDKKVENKNKRLRDALDKAGIEKSPAEIRKRVSVAAVFIILLIYGFVYWKFFTADVSLVVIILWSVAIMTLGFAALFFLCWILMYSILDLYKYNRRMELEGVLPDFLQLTAANIRAGMPIDSALWFAVRPRFGILAREVEIVAKRTMSGQDLEAALMEFSDKYDSVVLSRAIALLIEGIKGGGEIGVLLMNIANNIQEGYLLRKEMAANVVTYVIFISFATVGAAPFLFALSSQLLTVITKITSQVAIPQGGGGGPSFALSFSQVGITQSDFRIFAFVSLTISSMMSAIIIATIRKGNVKSGLKYIPIFILTTTLLYFIAEWALGKLLSGIF